MISAWIAPRDEVDCVTTTNVLVIGELFIHLPFDADLALRKLDDLADATRRLRKAVLDREQGSATDREAARGTNEAFRQVNETGPVFPQVFSPDAA